MHVVWYGGESHRPGIEKSKGKEKKGGARKSFSRTTLMYSATKHPFELDSILFNPNNVRPVNKQQTNQQLFAVAKKEKNNKKNVVDDDDALLLSSFFLSLSLTINFVLCFVVLEVLSLCPKCVLLPWF